MLRALFANKLLIGWIAGLVTAAIAGLVLAGWIIYGGAYDTSSSSPHTRMVAWAAHTTMIHSVKKRAVDALPFPTSHPPDVLAGAREYEKHCVACHGGPGVARATWVSALLPTPPFLIEASRRWSRAELYTIVHDGVKMTAMPAWGEIEPDRKIYDVVAFLEVLPKLTPDEFARVWAKLRAQPHPGSSNDSKSTLNN